MISTKTKSPDFHELQRLKNISGYVDKHIRSGSYDDDKERAISFLGTIRAKVDALEAVQA